MDNWSIDNTTLEAKYDEGYRAGSQDTAEHILSEIDKLSREGGVIWTNYARALLQQLKKKYEVE